MKNHVAALVLIGLVFCSFRINERDDILAYINHLNILKLVYQNDRCGEFGGDRETITIYRISFESDIYADYLKESIYCNNINLGKYKITKKDKIKMTEENKKTFIESINQLSSGILSHEDLPSHSGFYSQVTLSDSTISMSSFPSIRWTKFEQLRERLLNY